MCGLVQGTDSQTTNTVEYNTRFTNLFQEKGEKSQESGSSSTQGSDGGRTVCGSHWLIISNGDGKEIVGFCKKDNSGSTMFIEKTKSNEKVSLKVCVENCVNNQHSVSQGIKQFETFVGNGNEIKFYNGKK